MALKAVTMAELAERLGKLGVKENEHNLSNKIARGGFTAAFVFQVMKALGVETLNLEG